MEQVMSRSCNHKNAKKVKAVETSVQVEDLLPPEREPRKRRGDPILRDEDAEEFNPPKPYGICKKSERGAPLWIASKYATEIAFTFVMDDEELKRFLEPFGCKDPEFVMNALRQVANIGKLGPHVDQSTIDFYFAAIAAIKPRDAIETMLAAQMAALQPLITTAANSLAHAEYFCPEREGEERILTRLSRTFCKVVATFDHHREAGEQKVIVQHTSVGVAGDPHPSNVTSPNPDDRMHEPIRRIPKTESPQLAPLHEDLDNNGVIPLTPAGKKKNARRSPA